ncbi:MAG TPA: biotin transporter BioY [Terracidiphilus sp.]|nr:biotin transporter BioY [Terracidiphilus sp.]
MNKELSVSLSPAAVAAPTRATALLRAFGIVLGGSLLAAVCAHVSIPLFFTPVPLSLAPFAVLLLGLLLSPRLAAATFAAYLIEGAAGLPVFSPSPAISGFAHLVGPTGGYLLAYPLAGALISFLWRRSGRNFSAALLCAAVGDVAILTCGALWLAAMAPLPSLSAPTLAIFPFLPGDALKIAAAAAMAVSLRRLRRSVPENA